MRRRRVQADSGGGFRPRRLTAVASLLFRPRMTHVWTLTSLDEAGLSRLAETIALYSRAGDAVLLSGDLGAGKTTFARAFIRAVLADPGAEVPSPTFTLVQTYTGARFAVAHYDLYRIADSAEVAELGLDEALSAGVALIEWPERLAEPPSVGGLTIALREDGGDTRTVVATATGPFAPRLARAEAMHAFLDAMTTRSAGAGPSWRTARRLYLQGDASPRAYARLVTDRHRAVLMDAPRMPDGPPIRNGLPYSRIAHLAEDVRPFVAVGRELRRRGIAAPMILGKSLAHGLLLLEDQGDLTFGRALAAGGDQAELWQAAIEVLLALRAGGPPGSMLIDATEVYHLPDFDRDAMAIETELLVDWYWPARFGAPVPAPVRAEFVAAWRSVLDPLLAAPRGWVLRDYHSPNLMWRPERKGIGRVGVLDFQDAMSGPWAYDVVSLLQDARLDVPAALEADLKRHYIERMRAIDARFDVTGFELAYAALGVQRNTKILGIFARLARRDGKPQYLVHLPRIWSYVERSIGAPGLEPVRSWLDRHIPPARRSAPLDV